MASSKHMERIINFFIGAALLIVGTPVVLLLVNTTGLSTIGVLIVGTLFPMVFAFGGLYMMVSALRTN
jgi:hypothetical protein